MNYGKKNASKRKQSLTAIGPLVQHKFGAILLFLVLLVVIGGVCYGGYKVYGYAKGIIADTPDISTIDATPTGYMSKVLDADGNTIAELVGTGSNRVYVTIDEIPLEMQHAFVAIEDERFYEHNGIDLKGIARAAVVGVTTGRLSEGASTITQQLLKNNVFDGWTSESSEERIKRKLQEQYLALELEREVDKDWIMENYLNTINLGQNTLGVEAAANRYFGKTVTDLNLSECAVIAAITQNPSKYNPISHPDDNKERRQKVLENMKDQNFITKDEYQAAMEDDVYSRINENNTVFESKPSNITSYFVDSMTEQVIKDLQTQLGYSEAQAYKALYSGGLTIYSTQSPRIQEICDEVVNDDSYYSDVPKRVSFSYALTIQQEDGTLENYSEQTMRTWMKNTKNQDTLNFASETSAEDAIGQYREYLLQNGGTVIGENVTYTVQPQVSLTIMDQYTGEVKAVVGGRGEKTASKTLNRASDTTTQPGSTFKIITTYAPALEEGVISLATAVKDEEITYDSGKVVKNADGKYHGTVTIREGIKKSYNVVAIKTSREVTLEHCYQSALNFGITTLTDQDMVEALPLGGITNGVKNMELTAAYAAIANGGVYQEPILYTQILDHDGNVLLDRTPETHVAISDTTAFLLTSAMEDVVNGGTGTAAKFGGMSIAGKTGTTTSSRDAWFAAFTPYYTCAIWGGYDDNSELESTRYTRTIWKAIMQRVHEGLPDVEFDKPEGIITCTVCQQSGLLAGKNCSSTRTEFFAENTAPTKHCNAHETAVICKDSGKLAGPFCPETSKKTESFTKNGAPKDVCDVHQTPVEITPMEGVTVDPAAGTNPPVQPPAQ